MSVGLVFTSRIVLCEYLTRATIEVEPFDICFFLSGGAPQPNIVEISLVFPPNISQFIPTALGPTRGRFFIRLSVRFFLAVRFWTNMERLKSGGQKMVGAPLS